MNRDQHTDLPLKLSVFTIAYRTAGECLKVIQELQRQTVRAEMEIIIVAPDRTGLDETWCDEFGAWQWVILPEVRSCGEAGEAAVRAARAPYVTYAEEHTSFAATWAERLIEAHAQGYDAVGFVMENANPATLTSWAHLYGQFGPAVAPATSGKKDFLAGHHTSYRRQFLLAYDNRLSDVLENEAVLFLDLRAHGRPMFLAGNAVSWHVNISRLRVLVYMELVGQRSFAATRAKVGGWLWWKRALYAASTPLVPWLRLRRILADLRRTGRDESLLPALLAPLSLALLVGAWGEMVGYLFGPGHSAKQKAPIELQRARFLAAKDLL